MPKDLKDSKELQEQKASKDKKSGQKEKVPFQAPKKSLGDESFKIIRLAESDLYGNKKLTHALTTIKGVGWSYANAIVKTLNLENKLVADLSDAELDKIKDALQNPAKYNIPSWLFNRRKDRIRGDDVHIVSSDLVFAKKMDVESLKKIKCYKGVRHIYNYKVRGQRTRSRGANVKGRIGTTVGVIKTKAAPQKTEEK
jgi:small subunit ribosomal protein S13